MTDRWGGFRLTKVKTMPGDETEAFHAVITRRNALTGLAVEVGTVSNDGRGGCDHHRFADNTIRAEYIALAQNLYGSRFEPIDALDFALLTAASLTRKRSTPILLDPRVDFWAEDEGGSYSQFRPGFESAEVAANWLVVHGPAGARVWDPERADFVSAEELRTR